MRAACRVVLLWPPLRFVIPTLSTVYFNHHHLSGELHTVSLPREQWAYDEQQRLLDRSEERLRGLETKGPGLATVGAIVAAGVVAAIVEGGGKATVAGKMLLAIGAWYGIWSLAVPIYLVGPQARSTIDVHQLIAAADSEHPADHVAREAQAAAQNNVRRTQRIGNLQDAARNELTAALAFLVAWLILGPGTGLLTRTVDQEPSRRRPPVAAQQPQVRIPALPLLSARPAQIANAGSAPRSSSR